MAFALFGASLFIPPPASADTQPKTWTFTGDGEGLADAGNSATVDVYYNLNAFRASTIAKGLLGEVEFARNASTGGTWQTWGVPAGATVTAVQITAWQEYTTTNTRLVSHSLKARIIGSGGSTVHSAGDLLNADLGASLDMDWQNGSAGSQRAVDAGSQTSTTDVRLELEYTVSTTSTKGGPADVSQNFDNIEVTITYTPAAAARRIINVH